MVWLTKSNFLSVESLNPIWKKLVKKQLKILIYIQGLNILLVASTLMRKDYQNLNFKLSLTMLG